METEQLLEGLRQAFDKEAHRIVFWYDPEADFEADLADIDLPDLTVINMREESTFWIKLKLEGENVSGRYLLYFPNAEPAPDKNWLLDIQLYSQCFSADRVSLIFNELGLVNQSVRSHLTSREKFFADKRRMAELKKVLKADARENDIDLAMLAVITHAEQVNIAHIIFSLANNLVTDDSSLEENPALFEPIDKFGLRESLVKNLQKELGYQASVGETSGDESFLFGNFLIQLLVTEFVGSIGDSPDWAQTHILSGTNARASARTLLSHWRDSSRYYEAFDQISKWVSDALNLSNKLTNLSLETLSEVETFEKVERQIIVELANSIPGAEPGMLSSYADAISTRQDRYWASRHHDDDTRKKYRIIYRALSASIALFGLRHKYQTGFHFTSCDDMYNQYTDELYLFDMHYRHYCDASQRAHVDILKNLDDAVEKCYANWYLDHLAKSWGDKLVAEDRFNAWQLTGIHNQYQFYTNFVEPVISDKKSRRIVVIISDAFRYEAAVELTDRINEKRYCEASIHSQLGVLPSYTALGMASLLPHVKLEYREEIGDDVYVDGMSTKSTEARNKILSSYRGMAVTAEQLKEWSREEGREAIKDKQLIYVYHNVVDARGDTASTEAETFLAVDYAIEDLTELVRKIILNLNTSTVLVTADHGFLFQQSKLEASDKANLEKKPKNALKSKKRYVIGKDLPEDKDVWSGMVKETAGSYCDTRFWIPKGANRFHFVGGARFVHGGAMPQEIVVPVIIAKSLRGDKAKERTKRKVGVISTKSTLKMMNNIQSFDLMQTDAVSDHMLSVTVIAGIYDGEILVSSEEKVSFDSSSDNMSDRVKSVRLSLSGNTFDCKKDYYLILRDADFKTEIERYQVTIDLAFTDDFS